MFESRDTISKTVSSFRVAPNVADYEHARTAFSWDEAARALDGLPGGGLNIAHECVDRHARGARGDHVALRCIDGCGNTAAHTFRDLADSTDRFANVLRQLDVQAGDRVFVLLERSYDLHVAVLGTLKHRAVACTLFSAFGPEPIRQRMTIGEASALITTARLYERKVVGIRDQLPALRHVLVTDASDVLGTQDLRPLMANASSSYHIGPTSLETPSVLHFTSGTTGTPKGAIHVHGAIIAHHATARSALDLHPDDVFWCTADPGWVTGTSYGIVAPLALGVTSIVDEGDFDVERWYSILADQQVSVFYTSPTAVRMMMRAGSELAQCRDLPHLRFIASVGEALNPDAVRWGVQTFGLPIHDNWWQTETGGIMIANLAATDIRPGSMGRPVPGIDVAVLRLDPNGKVIMRSGHVEQITEPMVEGELAVRVGWPSMFRGYLGNDDRYRACFVDGWYRSGDLVKRDADGYVWFVGRGDDVIKSSGHLIGPFEIESTLMEHPAVADAAAIGLPDELAGEVVKAFVVLRPRQEPNEAMRRDLIAFSRKRLGAAIAPKLIGFVQTLPKTRSGKTMRRLLRARELGLPEGDLSTLESG